MSSATTVAPPPARQTRRPSDAAPTQLPVAVLTPVTTGTAVASSYGIVRWATGFAVPFVLGAIFFGLALATGTQWPIGFSVVLGPIALMFTMIYLCLTSDSNGKTPAGPG